MCLQSILVYDSETWSMRVEDMQHLERTEQMAGMCGMSLKNRVASLELNKQMGIVGVVDVVKQG
jgi:hypothetical protein